MKFIIEQLALCPRDPVAAKQLLREMGAVTWHHDRVNAEGHVRGEHGANAADLSFHYDMHDGELELEVLHYVQGPNWMDTPERENSVSHLGMHCTAEELEQWRAFFLEREIPVIQEVYTQSHTNPAISGIRWYHYVIFDTRDILGVDLKFIVRRSSPGAL